MADPRQRIFKKIVVFNKLLDEANADKLLRAAPDPDDAIKYLVRKKLLPLKKGQQLAELYHKQLAQASSLAVREAAKKATEAKSSLDDFDHLIDDVMNEVRDDSPSHILSKSALKMGAEADGDDDGAGDSQVLGGDILAEGTAALDEVSDSSLTLGGKKHPTIAGEDSKLAGGSDTALEDAPAAAITPPAAAPAAVAAAPSAPPAKDAATQTDDLPSIPLADEDEEAPPAKPATAPAPTPSPTSSPPTAAKPKGPATRGEADPLMVELMLAARKLNASDLHIKSGEPPIARVAGSLKEIDGYQAIDPQRAEQALLSLLNSHQREHFLATNDIDLCYDGGEKLGRYRTNMMRQHRGMDGVFRLIATEAPGFDDLKLPPVVKTFTEYKQGIVLITGPKGSGKTTTLAAMVDLINRTRQEHIITIEDPIEFVHPCKKGHVNQREVGAHTGSFSNALRAALREAPDVIMVGEMRDLETTSLAITAAETGHLVFATLHTPDAVRTIDRVLDVFPPKEQGQIRSMISESLRGIVSQLLVPGVDGKSQHLAVEIMVNTLAIGNMIREAKTFQLRGVIQTGNRLGMTLMDDSLVRLLKAGLIAKEEAMALAVERSKIAEGT
ncbi:MAG: PilT/PilU family type 4a pilus ATPase [Pirellulales bacterium]